MYKCTTFKWEVHWRLHVRQKQYNYVLLLYVDRLNCITFATAYENKHRERLKENENYPQLNYIKCHTCMHIMHHSQWQKIKVKIRKWWGVCSDERVTEWILCSAYYSFYYQFCFMAQNLKTGINACIWFS